MFNLLYCRYAIFGKPLRGKSFKFFSNLTILSNNFKSFDNV